MASITISIAVLAYLSTPSTCFQALPTRQTLQLHRYSASHTHLFTSNDTPQTEPLQTLETPEPPSSSSRPSSSRRSSSARSPREGRERRERRPPPSQTRVTRSNDVPVARKRAPHQFDHTKEEARPFLDDAAAIVRDQSSNEDAPLYIFPEDENDDGTPTDGNLKLIPEGTHLQYVSLDSLFPNLNLAELFHTNSNFRKDLRNAMREDIFDSTPAYSGMSEKARRMLLLPDSSLQGSWRCAPRNENGANEANGANGEKGEKGANGATDVSASSDEQKLRMVKLTQVLTTYLSPTNSNDSNNSNNANIPTGDEFMNRIGALCGSHPSTHWIDIVGITDRKIPHSWHQDTGLSPSGPNGDRKTVMLGFPKEDNYEGVGVFSHAMKLKYERVAEKEHSLNEPVVYPKLEVGEEFVVRPVFGRGKEICLFRDVDVLHSAPDVSYRDSVMRFM